MEVQTFSLLKKFSCLFNFPANGNITEIDMSQLESGLYFINAISEDLQSTFKVIKR